MEQAAAPVFVVVDGENIDATLGTSILLRRPEPKERPRWDRVADFARSTWGPEARCLFYFNATNLKFPNPFVQALTALNYRPVLLQGPPEVKIVDVAILRTLETLREIPGDVVLVSNDGDFLTGLEPLLDGTRRVGILGFREHLSSSYLELEQRGLEIYDLEHDVGAFNVVLPRLRIIPIEEFDPLLFLGPDPS
ncbi:NYN domain-containing protein [Nakamurella sp. YIM 132087]|uniref:NYN domain-containing protein n=1 Tax=Nakamurella alba TaxID=2665158 RepID=A0A7K1FET9_9ACTN|nr:NYN domain-containing protein [Nakamurella alba]MTD12621.1 NYN domain-containing protein [Nakamurella alba]